MATTGGDGFNWRNHYGCAASDDRRLKIGAEAAGVVTMVTTTTWPSQPIVWMELPRQLSLFIISLDDDDGTELLVSAYSFDEAWLVASGGLAKQAMRQTGARAVEISILPENIVEIPSSSTPRLLHVFESKERK